MESPTPGDCLWSICVRIPRGKKENVTNLLQDFSRIARAVWTRPLFVFKIFVSQICTPGSPDLVGSETWDCFREVHFSAAACRTVSQIRDLPPYPKGRPQKLFYARAISDTHSHRQWSWSVQANRCFANMGRPVLRQITSSMICWCHVAAPRDTRESPETRRS